MANIETANKEEISISTDPLNVIGSPVKPLPPHVIDKIIKGRTAKTQILDGSILEQHDNLILYALTHVSMTFDNEEDIIRCARMLQWSDERMRARTDPKILWVWKQSFRDGMTVHFSVGWYSKEFFEERKDAFLDVQHSGYYAKFGLKPADVKTQNEIVSAN